jgi:hypothetical protein
MKIIVSTLLLLVFIPGCVSTSDDKRESVAKTYADFVDGTVVSCNHPKYDNEKSECLIEIGLECKRLIMVDDVGAELKEEICP